MLSHLSPAFSNAKCACTADSAFSARRAPAVKPSTTCSAENLRASKCEKQSRVWCSDSFRAGKKANLVFGGSSSGNPECRRSRNGVRAAVVVDAAEEAGATPMGLQVAETLEANSRVRLEIRVPPELCMDSYSQVIKELGKKTKVPGFRPGKRVPENVLVDYIGKNKVKSSAVESILKRTLPEAMATVAGRAIKESEHILTKFEDLEASFSPSSGLSYDVAVDVIPEVKWASENAYKNLKVVVEVPDESLPEKAAEAELRSRYKDLGSLRIVNGRGIQMGDVAIVDVSACRILDDGTVGDKILSAEQKGFQLDTEEAGNLLPGLVEAVIGMNVDENRTFNLTFPETWQQEALRGVAGRFSVTVKEVFIRVLPELDDSLASKIIENCTSLEQVKQVLLKKHQQISEDARKQAVNMAITDELAKVTIVDVPNSLLEEQGRQMYAAKLMELQANMKLSKEQLVQFTAPAMLNNYLVQKKETIKDAVKLSLAVTEIYKLENLSYTEEELEREVQMAIAEFQQFKQEYDKTKVREQAQEMLEGSKVLDWLLNNAEVTYITPRNDNSYQFSFKTTI